MTTIGLRARRLVGILLTVALLQLGVPASAGAAQGYSVNVAERADFVAQTNFVQCVGASMQMMLNMIEPGRDRSATTQLKLQKLARSWSGSRPDGRERQGASVRGWAAGLNILGAGPYKLVGEATLEAALKTAARAIAPLAGSTSWCFPTCRTWPLARRPRVSRSNEPGAPCMPSATFDSPPSRTVCEA